MTLESELHAIIDDPEDELLVRLGLLLLGDNLGIGPSADDRKRRFALNWLQERRDQLRGYVCGPATEAFLNTDAANRLTEAAVVADALSAAYGRPAASVVAVILVRRGLGTLCAD